MIRGKRIFQCPECGEIFVGVDIEYNCMVFSCPQPCPKCGTECAPVGQNGLYRRIGIIRTEGTKD